MGPEILNVMGLIFPVCIGIAAFPTILDALDFMNDEQEEER